MDMTTTLKDTQCIPQPPSEYDIKERITRLGFQRVFGVEYSNDFMRLLCNTHRTFGNLHVALSKIAQVLYNLISLR